MMSPRIRLGPQGPEFSRIVAGVWRMAEWRWSVEQRREWIEQCLALGVTTFDHADIYGGYTIEQLFGEALREAPSLRDRIELVSKCGIALTTPNRPQHRIKHYATTRAHIVASVENSLSQLGTEYLDLLLIHRPDPLMDADEVAEAFTALRAAGKVRHFGVSNFTPAQFELLDSRVPLVTNQVECSLLNMQALHDGTFDQAQRLRRPPMLWSPLAGGGLFRGEAERDRRVRNELQRLAHLYGVSAASVAYLWLLQLPCAPLPITGSGRIEAIKEAVAATGLMMDRQDWFGLWQASMGREVP